MTLQDIEKLHSNKKQTERTWSHLNGDTNVWDLGLGLKVVLYPHSHLASAAVKNI